MEQVQATELELAIKAAFDNGISAEKGDDDIKLDMIGAGATFKNVTRLFNQFMVDSGLVVKREERDQILAEKLQDVDLTDEEAFNAKVSEVMEVLGGNEKSASSLIRSYAKKQGREVFKKVRVATGARKNGFNEAYFEYLRQNPLCTEEQAIAFIDGTDGHEETSNSVKGKRNHYLAIRELVAAVAGAVQVA